VHQKQNRTHVSGATGTAARHQNNNRQGHRESANNAKALTAINVRITASARTAAPRRSASVTASAPTTRNSRKRNGRCRTTAPRSNVNGNNGNQHQGNGTANGNQRQSINVAVLTTAHRAGINNTHGITRHHRRQTGINQWHQQ